MNRQGEATSEPDARGQASDVAVEGASEGLAKSGPVDGGRTADQERYEQALGAAQVGVWDWDLATGEIYLDPRLKAMLGFEDHEIRNHADDWGMHFHPDDLGLVMNAVLAHLSGEVPRFEVEHRMLHKDGSIRWFAGSGSVVRDERGEPVRLLGTDTDITERKRLEEAYHALVDHSLQGLFIIQDGRPVFVNRAYAEMSGYTVAELLAFSSEQTKAVVHPEERDLVWGRHLDRLQGKHPVDHYEYRSIRKDGSVMWLEIHARAIAYQGKPAVQAAVVDITARKRAEEELWSTHESYRGAIKNAGGMAYRRQFADNQYDWVGEGCEELLGISAERFTTGNFQDLVREVVIRHPRAPADKEAYKRAYRSGAIDSYRVDVRIVTPGGEEKWVSDDAVLYRDPGTGEPVGSLGILQDVTERKRDEEAVVRAKREWERTFDAVPDLIAITDADYRILRVNRAMADRLGIRPEEAVGLTCYEYVHGSKLPPAFCPNVRTLADGQEHTAEVYEERLGGEFLITTSPLHDHDGRLIGSVHVARDITQRKRAERALQQAHDELEARVAQRTAELRATNESLEREISDRKRAEEAYRTLVDHSLQGLIIAQDERFVFANQAFADMSGYTVAELQSMSAKQTMATVHPDDRPLIRKRYEERIQGKPVPERYEYRGIRKDGSVFWVEMHASLIEYRGGPAVQAAMVDITDRKQAEEALRENKEKYEGLYNNAQAGLARCRISDGKLLEANHRLAEMFGYADVETLIAGFDVETHYADRATRRRLVAGLRETGEFRNLEARCSRRDGTEFWIRCSGRRPPGQDYVEGDAIDVTEQKQAEEALRESEERFRTFLEDLSDAAYTADARGNITYLNKYSEGLTGLPMEEVIHKPFLPLFTEESRRVALDVYERTLKGDSTEFELTFNTGKVCQFRQKPLRDHDGNLIGVSGIARDVTEHRQAEAALRQSEQYFRSLIENASDLITILGEDGRMQYRSPSFEHVLGYDRDQIIGKNAFELIHPEDVDRVRDTFVRGSRIPGHVESTEFRFRHATGSWRVLETTGTNLLFEPAVRGVVINARDITDRKEAEAASLVFGQSIEQSTDAIFTINADRRITFANNAAEKLYGYTAEEMVGCRPRDLLRIDPAIVKDAWGALARDRRWSAVHDAYDKEGNRISVDVNLMQISDEQGKLVAAVSLSRDARGSRRLEAIQQVAEVAAGTDAADDEAVQRIMSHLPELVGLDQWAIYLYDPDKDALVLRFSSKPGREIAEAIPHVPLSAPLSGQVFGSGEIVFSHDISSDDRFTRNATFRKAMSTPSGQALRATCILPLRSGGRILGTLYLSDNRVRTFTPEELSISKTLASQVGLFLSRHAPGPGDQEHPPVRSRPTDSASVVADSETMQLVLRSAQRVAHTEMPAVILGPTGAGKGHLAKYIHSISPRANGPFMTVNCACLDGELILSELFGHERGAFTGAVRQQKGCFELANGGTLLLDEVVELPLSAQAKLLQLVETQQFRRLGGQRTITTDVRIICTTNADIRECVRTGKMREDLYYRLNAGEIVIPPLRERPEDIRSLAMAYLRTQSLATGEPACTITDGALARLREYSWPGNVRELQNVLALAMSHGGQVIGASDLRFAPAVVVPAGPVRLGGEKSDRETILTSLRRNRWNRTLTAEELGIHRNTLRNRMRKYGIFE